MVYVTRRYQHLQTTHCLWCIFVTWYTYVVFLQVLEKRTSNKYSLKGAGIQN